MGARYYDPVGGRFLSPDPVGHPINLDLYAYANGDPINFNDPDGRFASFAYNSIESTVISGFGQLQSNYRDFRIGLDEAKNNWPIQQIEFYQTSPFNDRSVGHTLGTTLGNFEAGYEYIVDAASPKEEGMTLGVLPPPSSGLLPKKIHNSLPIKNVPEINQYFSSMPKKVQLNLLHYSESPYNAGVLKEHLRQAEKYGQAGYKFLMNGKVRYYGEISLSQKVGEMMGRRLVREWDPQKDCIDAGMKRLIIVIK
jgi:uncharacterized protein RhaS with RHS repeats